MRNLGLMVNVTLECCSHHWNWLVCKTCQDDQVQIECFAIGAVHKWVKKVASLKVFFFHIKSVRKIQLKLKFRPIRKHYFELLMDFYKLTWRRIETFKLGSSLVGTPKDDTEHKSNLLEKTTWSWWWWGQKSKNLRRRCQWMALLWLPSLETAPSLREKFNWYWNWVGLVVRSC